MALLSSSWPVSLACPECEIRERNRQLKKNSLLAMTLMATLALGACGNDKKDDSGNAGPATADLRIWLNGPDTPQDARDWLKKTFEDQNPGSTLTIEEQQWEGLVERLTTSLSSDTETPDVVEVGNTQAATFTGAGAFSDSRRPFPCNPAGRWPASRR